MGVLTDILIADKDEANKIASMTAPWQQWKAVDAKGHNDLTLGVLFCILQGRPFDVQTIDEFSLLAESSKQGPWVFEIPNEFILSLTQTADADLPDVVSKWMETGELKDGAFDETINFIRDLRDLAEESLLQRKNLLMWICL